MALGHGHYALGFIEQDRDRRNTVRLGLIALCVGRRRRGSHARVLATWQLLCRHLFIRLVLRTESTVATRIRILDGTGPEFAARPIFIVVVEGGSRARHK